MKRLQAAASASTGRSLAATETDSRKRETGIRLPLRRRREGGERDEQVGLRSRAFRQTTGGRLRRSAVTKYRRLIKASLSAESPGAEEFGKLGPPVLQRPPGVLLNLEGKHVWVNPRDSRAGEGHQGAADHDEVQDVPQVSEIGAGVEQQAQVDHLRGERERHQNQSD